MRRETHPARRMPLAQPGMTPGNGERSDDFARGPLGGATAPILMSAAYQRRVKLPNPHPSPM